MATVLLTLACGLMAGRFSHELGVAPILGAILCAGYFLKPRELWIVGLGGILVRDLLIGLSAFTMVRLIGVSAVVATILVLKIRPNFRSILMGLLVSSPIFHMVLAVGDWATGTCAVVPKTPQGLWISLSGAIPYFQRSFVGDLLFTSLFLGGYVFLAYAFQGVQARAFSSGQ